MEHHTKPSASSAMGTADSNAAATYAHSRVEKVREKRAHGRPALTRDRLTKLLTYYPEVGVFRHKVSRGGQRDGDVAGTISPSGYRLIFLDYFQWRASHLAWLYMTGRFPPPGMLVDHRDCERANDRWNNLRLATPAQNARNRLPCGRNTTGKVGVHPISDDLYGASIGVGGRNIHLGRFRCLDDAVAVRCEAERHYFGEFARDASHWNGAKEFGS